MIKKVIIKYKNKKFIKLNINKNYWISEYGDVYSTKTKKIMKHSICRGGHHRINIFYNNKQEHFLIHRLVYETFVGKIDKKMQINHIDDDKDNNHFSNLYMGTQKQNMQDKKKNCHAVGNIMKLVIYDKKYNKILVFCPAINFLKYSGHMAKNGGVSRAIKRLWFKKNYKLISYERINNLKELTNVTTISDECN